MNCPNCNRTLKHRAINNDNICEKCNMVFDNSLVEVKLINGSPYKLSRDNCGNYYFVKIENKDGQIWFTTVYCLELGRTTLRGEYPKFRDDDKCKYPKRLSCNHGYGFDRCEFMTYGGSIGNWTCKYKK